MSATRIAPSAATISLGREQLVSANNWRSLLCLTVGDCLALLLLSFLIVALRHVLTPSYSLSSELQFFPLIALTLTVFWMSGLYPAFLLHPAEEMKRIFVGVSFVLFLLAVSTFLWRTNQDYSRSVFLTIWALSAPILFLSRRLLRAAVRGHAWWGAPAVILGSGSTARRIAWQLKSRHLGLRVIGVLSDEPSDSWPSALPPILGSTTLAPALAASGQAQYAIVAMANHGSAELRHLIQDNCKGFHHVLLIPDLPGLCSLGVAACDLGGEIGLEIPQRLFHAGSATIKRLLDFIATSLLLIAISPLFLLVALVIKLTSRGPVFFSQLRYGKNGATFRARKFRTMIQNSQDTLANYLLENPQARQEWLQDQKLKNDPRITPIGKYLRRFSIDELPQLLNILAGQMSLVGPRPIVESEIEKYGRGYNLYRRVLPGLTGLWQVSGRNNTTYAERVAYDEFYVNNWSVWLDVYILLRTVRVVIKAEGAY